MGGRMTLDEFKASLEGDIETFVTDWKLSHANPHNDPEHWPLEMDEGDWYDQFLMWMGGASTKPMSDADFESDKFA